MATANKPKKEIQKNDEIRVVEPIPDPTEGKPNQIITTKRKLPIKRGNNDQMTTDSGRFKES